MMRALRPSKEVTVKVFVNPCASAMTVAAACAFGLALPMAAWADDEPLPLFLTTSLTLEHDSNFSRTPQATSETIRSLGLAAGLNKAHGRQNYLLYGQLTQNKYNRYGDLLDNDGKNLNAAFDTEIASNWKAGLGYRYNENLNAIQDNSNALNQRVVRNMRRYRDVNGELRYGVSGRFAVVASVDQNTLTYSAQPGQNADQQSHGIRVQYNPSDLLSFGLGPRWVETEYPNRTTNRKVRDRNLDFTTNWRVSGISVLTGRLTWGKTRNSDVQEASDAFTGAVGWVYTPRGPLTYSVNWSRATDTDRLQESQYVIAGGQLFETLGSVVDDRITNTLALGARYKASAKISLGAGYRHVSYDNSRVGSNAVLRTSTTRSSDSNYQALSLDASYQPMRSLELGCNWQRYKQTPDLFRIEYKGHATSCSANFTID